MNSGSSDPSWFQIVIGIVLAGLSAAWAWAQFQINNLRRDDERAEDRAVKAVDALRAEFNARHTEHCAVQERQHDDNRAEMAATRSQIQSASDTAALERRRVADALERLLTKIGTLPDRDEVMKMIGIMKP